MEIVTSWERKGMHEGKESLLARQIKRRFGSFAPEVARRLDALSSDQLDELGEALFDFATVSDLDVWLSRVNSH